MIDLRSLIAWAIETACALADATVNRLLNNASEDDS